MDPGKGRFFASFLGDTDSALLVYLLLVVSLGVGIALILLSPFMIASDNFSLVGMAALLYKAMGDANVCHQLPQRTLALGGILLPVCARDLSIFMGGFFGLLVSPMKAPRTLSSKWTLLLATIPIAVDGITQTILRLRESTDATRLATGFVFGLVCAHFLGKRLLEERTSANLRKNFKVASSLVLVPLLLFACVGMVLGAFHSSRSMAIDAALEERGRIGNHLTLEAYYLPPKSIFTIPLDPFLQTYDDLVLTDIVTLRIKPAFGLWVVLVLEEPPRREGKVVFLSGGRGEYFYIDALTGEIVAKKIHR